MLVGILVANFIDQTGCFTGIGKKRSYMLKKFAVTGLGLMTLVMGLFWVGCSDDTIVTNSLSGAASEVSPVTKYFPMAEGYTTVFDITWPDSRVESKSFTIGNEVELAGINAVEWLSYSNSSGIDTGYFHATSTALYYYDDPGASPEKILELPLVPGANWIRFGDNDNLTSNLSDSTADNKFTTDDDDIGGSNAKNFPSAGYSKMVVEKVESLQLDNGSFYSGTIKIFSENSNGTINLYWYAPGVGLVRYVINASSTNLNGSEMGELKSFGQR